MNYLRLFLGTMILTSYAAAQGNNLVTEANCTAAKVGDQIPASAIGEPVSAVTLAAPKWNAAAKGGPAYCSVNGSIAPVDKAPNAKPINFQVAFPPVWNGSSAHLGGGGINGVIPRLTGGPTSPFGMGYVTYGSDWATRSRVVQGADPRLQVPTIGP